jgi:hypothetical protein
VSISGRVLRVVRGSVSLGMRGLGRITDLVDRVTGDDEYLDWADDLLDEIDEEDTVYAEQYIDGLKDLFETRLMEEEAASRQASEQDVWRSRLMPIGFHDPASKIPVVGLTGYADRMGDPVTLVISHREFMQIGSPYARYMEKGLNVAGICAHVHTQGLRRGDSLGRFIRMLGSEIVIARGMTGDEARREMAQVLGRRHVVDALADVALREVERGKVWTKKPLALVNNLNFLDPDGPVELMFHDGWTHVPKDASQTLLRFIPSICPDDFGDEQKLDEPAMTIDVALAPLGEEPEGPIYVSVSLLLKPV